IVAGLGTTMPVVGGVIEELSFMADNDIAVGYLGNYELVDRKEIQTATSTDVLFFEDQTAFKGTARYDGKPVIAEAFALFNIANTAPTTTTTFPEDVANKVVEPTTPKE
ncbi:phage major capsid protein, partial [uncultured Dubosiella sp.]|uniref:phage major capsid protein n=1 Tax=uncultured Dubosiella sp. TaxID=1937011 RepID=UPI0025B5BACB